MNLIDIPSLIKKADELQPLPGSVVKLITLLSGGETDVDEITRVIRFDPTLTVRLLRMANSAFSGASVTITTVHEAVSRLGTQRVLSLAVAAHTRPLLRVQVTAYGYREGELWRHSVLAMLAAESAPSACRVPVPPASSTAALLHDIGKLVMAHFLDPEILDLLGRAQNEGGLGPMEAETQILQVHHGELGGLIARHWNLPEPIINGITFHHNPELGGDPVCDVVHVANVVAKQAQAKILSKETSASINPDAAERLGLAPENMELIVNETVASFSKVGGLFGAA
jgi:putative nucleotidyltransferase with HDIG domain